MPDYKPWVDKKITDWSGARSEEPTKEIPLPQAREVFAPARKLMSPEEVRATMQAEEARPKKRAPRPSYRLPE